MNGLNDVLTVLPVLIPILVGRFVVWCKLLHPREAKTLSTIFLYVCLPSLIIWLIAPEDFRTLFDIAYILASLCLTAILYVGLLAVHTLIFRRSLKVSTLAAFAGSKFSAGVLGPPVLLVTIGHYTAVSTAINLLIGFFVLTPLTLLSLNFTDQNPTNQVSQITIILNALKSSITHPIIIATIIGFCLSAGGIELPIWLNNTLKTLGNGTVPMALIAIGMNLNISSLPKDVGEVVWVSLVRVVLSPLLAIIAAKWFALSPVFAIALVMSFGLPTSSIVFPLSQKYGVFEESSADITSLTTIAFMITWPIMIWICVQLWPGVIHSI